MIKITCNGGRLTVKWLIQKLNTQHGGLAERFSISSRNLPNKACSRTIAPRALVKVASSRAVVANKRVLSVVVRGIAANANPLGKQTS
jgi:hypothetical protein